MYLILLLCLYSPQELHKDPFTYPIGVDLRMPLKTYVEGMLTQCKGFRQSVFRVRQNLGTNWNTFDRLVMVAVGLDFGSAQQVRQPAVHIYLVMGLAIFVLENVIL